MLTLQQPAQVDLFNMNQLADESPMVSKEKKMVGVVANGATMEQLEAQRR